MVKELHGCGLPSWGIGGFVTDNSSPIPRARLAHEASRLDACSLRSHLTTSYRSTASRPEQASGGSPDVAWLLAGDSGEGHLYSAGDRLPIGIEAFPGREHNDLVLWIEVGVRSSRAMRSSTSVAASRFHASGYGRRYARTDRRRTAAAARAAGRGRAPGARSTDRPCCS
jgi:hypothetical protein